MTTRHVSAEVVYPFIPPVENLDASSYYLRDYIGGILDVYFFIQGPPTNKVANPPVSNADTQAKWGDWELLTGDVILGPASTLYIPPAPDLRRGVFLDQILHVGDITIFNFRAEEGENSWEMEFHVPNSNGSIGQTHIVYNSNLAFNSELPYSQGVLIYKSDDITQITESRSMRLEVEPSRYQFHTKEVSSIEFYNTWRCADGSEIPTASSLVQRVPLLEVDRSAVEQGSSCIIQESSSTDTVDCRNLPTPCQDEIIPGDIPETDLDTVIVANSSEIGVEAPLFLEDGYNTEVSMDSESGEIKFTGQIGAGKGVSPDLGETAGSNGWEQDIEGSSSQALVLECGDVSDEDEIITLVNGIRPSNGDIPLEVSRSMGTIRNRGLIQIFPRF